MKTYQLFVDSHSDLSREEAEKLGYIFIAMPYSIKGALYFPYRGMNPTPEHFYELMREGVEVKTHSLNIEEYKQIFFPTLEKGLDIVYVSLSSKMTGTFNNLNKAWDELKREFPKRKFFRIDTKAVTAPMNFLARYLAGLATLIDNPETLIEYSKDIIERIRLYFFPDNLEHFKRGGRVSNSAALMGKIFGIRPLMTINAEGELVVLKKIKGRKKVMEAIGQLVAEELDEDEKDILFANSNASPEMVNNLVKCVFSNLKQSTNVNVQHLTINPTTGAHCGPDDVGVCFIAKKTPQLKIIKNYDIIIIQKEREITKGELLNSTE